MSEAWDAGGPYVTDCHEPRQVREEATVSGSVRVVSFSALHPRSVAKGSDFGPLAAKEGLLSFRFDVLDPFPIAHFVFSRLGGVSPNPFASLNVSSKVGDHPNNVRTNLKRISEALKVKEILTLEQVHGDTITVAHEAIGHPPRADGVVTNVPYLPIMIKQADCQGIIIYDPRKHAIAMVHCGWRGNALNLPQKVVDKMEEIYGTRPGDLIACIGPSIGPCCAEYRDWKRMFPDFFGLFRRDSNYFDLKAITAWQLTNRGLPSENIFSAEICTACNTDLFYSHRKEVTTGRFATVAYLLPK